MHYDPETGVFSWIKARAGLTVGVAGTLQPNGYRRICLDQRLYWAHRLAWFYMTGKRPENIVDHIDGAPSNNRWANLRDVTQRVNLQNQRRGHSDSKTGILGVTPHGRDFMATIKVDGANKYLGLFSTPEKAQEAYLAAKRKWHAGGVL
jgi:hypothetical protein